MRNIDNERLPQPISEELHYTKKSYYNSRVWSLVSPEKYGVDSGDFQNWVNKTFDEFYLHNKHITYREYKKLQ